MKAGIIACVAAMTMCAAAGERESREDELRTKLPDVFAKSAAHYRALDAAATPLMRDKAGKLRYPHGYRRDRRELDMRSVYGWTAGHFPGALWYLYEATGDDFLKARAVEWTEIVAPNSKVTGNHDVGFIMYCSFGNARRLLKTDRYDALLAETAESLSVRYNENLGLIRSWGKPDEAKEFLVIPDNMMNLELMEAVSKFSGNDKYAKIARSHADVTMKHHFRADGGCYHVLNYDQRPGFVGRVQEIRRGQGLSCETAWSRGQSWAIYGYTMMYRESKDPAYLAFAQKLADFAVNNPNMPADGIPCWDYGAPGEERDSSAGAIMASALLELSGFVPGEKGAAYRAFAVKQLLSLASPAYFSEGDEVGHFLLKHGVGHKPGHSEVDTPLNYGDYYFLEALLRFKALRPLDGVAAAGVDARYLPERMDDFLFENAYAAFRVYGPKLARPKPEGQGFSSNGIDVFNKGVADVCGAETVLGCMKAGKSYHADNGRCFDPYTVGPGCGCGGIRRRTAAGEWTGDGNWKSQRVVEKTAARAVFELDYATYTLRGTVAADSPFVRFDVTPKAASPGAAWGPGLDVAPSRGHEGVQLVDVGRGCIANAETASGTYTAVVVPKSSGEAQIASEPSGCPCLLVPDGPFTYYVAAAWRGKGDFPTAESWFALVRAFADSVR